MRIRLSSGLPPLPVRRNSVTPRTLILAAMTCLAHVYVARAADAPAWLHSLVSVPLPAHDDETNAVLLYSESILTVQGPGKIKRLDRKAYRILRRDGED